MTGDRAVRVDPDDPETIEAAAAEHDRHRLESRLDLWTCSCGGWNHRNMEKFHVHVVAAVLAAVTQEAKP